MFESSPKKEGDMNRHTAFGELAEALSFTRQADNVVLALAKIENGRDLTETDRCALRYAHDFLEEVHSGSRWLSEEQFTINQESARTMSSFVRAAESLSSAQSFDGLLGNIDELLRSAKAVDAGKAEPEQLKALRKFFGSILKNTLDQVDRSFASSDKLVASV